MEKRFNLIYYTNVTFVDLDNLELKLLNWLYGRLIKKKREEADVISKHGRVQRRE